MNSFGKTSQFKITASLSKSGNKTIVKDSFFTAPFKIMKPFERKDGGISVFQQTASAGILAGDTQEQEILVEKGATLEIISQSFEKIFKMEEGEMASRKIQATVEENATLFYTPLPCVPFEDSNFQNETKIHLSESSRLFYKDCITSGRKAFGEEFLFTRFANKIEIRQNINGEEKLIFRDNTVFEGKEIENIKRMKSATMFDGFSHAATIILVGFGLSSKDVNRMLNLPEKLLYTEENLKSEGKMLVGVTDFGHGICVRILANSAEAIKKVFVEN